MEVNDLVFYLLDLAIFIMLIQWLRNSSKVVVESTIGAKWLIPALFLLVAVIGVFRYQGIFRIIQTSCLVVFALLYYKVKSGLSEDGIVSMGTLVKWEHAGKVTLDKSDACLRFKKGKKDLAIFFDDDEVPAVREFLKKKMGK